MKLTISELNILTNLAINVTNETKTDVFFDFAPHVGSIRFDIHRHGWSENEVRRPASYTFDLGDEKEWNKDDPKELKALLSFYSEAIVSEEAA